MLISKMTLSRFGLAAFIATVFTFCMMAPNAVQAELEFKSEEVHQPIIVVFNSWDGAGCQGWGRSNFVKRLDLNLCSATPTYSYVTSSGVSMPVVNLSPSEARQLTLFLAAASPSCPVTISFDRNTFQIVKPITSKCDPVAALETEDNEG